LYVHNYYTVKYAYIPGLCIDVMFAPASKPKLIMQSQTSKTPKLQSLLALHKASSCNPAPAMTSTSICQELQTTIASAEAYFERY